MEYQQYFEKVKNKIKNLTTLQKVTLYFLGVVIVLVGIYFYNPPKKLLKMRNSDRRKNVVNILNAVYQYAAKHEGNLPFVLVSDPIMICAPEANSCDGLADFSQIVSEEIKILSEIPVDPMEKNPNFSGYQIFKSSNGRITVTAPLAENKAVISLSK